MEREPNDLAKVYSFAEEKRKRGTPTEKRFKRETLPEVIDLSVKRTEWEVFDDNEALRAYWEKRRLNRFILSEKNNIPSYEETIRMLEVGDYNFLRYLNGELINGPMSIRVSDGSLVKFNYPINRGGMVIYPAYDEFEDE